MKNPTFPTAARLAKVVAGTALAALAVAQVQAAPAAAQGGRQDKAAIHTGTAGDASEPGTIPAARPGLPQMPRGAEGPLRTDAPQTKADPSLRDSHPLTVNGLWETLPGNVIAKPLPPQ